MVQLSRSVHHLKFTKRAVEHVELPLFTFNKMCYAFLNNDLIMVASSMFTLLTTVTFMIFSRHLNINS